MAEAQKNWIFHQAPLTTDLAGILVFVHRLLNISSINSNVTARHKKIIRPRERCDVEINKLH